VFADGLVLARAIKVLDHGVLVGEPPNLWLMRDTNGDLRADTRQLVTNRYGRADANVEHNANSLYWAMDNVIYTSEVDISLRLKPGNTGSVVIERSAGVPLVSFDVLGTLSRGQWGVSQDDAGHLYRNTNESSLHVDTVPTRYFSRHPTLLRTRGSYESLEGDAREVNRVWPVHPTPGVNRGYQDGILKADGTLANFTSAASPMVYRGDRLPAELRGNVFVVEPAANLVSRIIVDNGPTSLIARKAYEGAEFLASTDERFRPVFISTAPDGTLYLLDLYRGIIQHRGYITEYLHRHIVQGELDAPTGFGRIYRIAHETTRRDRKPAMSRMSPAQLVAQLSHPNGWRRDAAQRLLVERQPRAAVPGLTRLAETGADWRGRLHALWTLDGLTMLTPETVVKALNDANRDVRVTALRLSERWLASEEPTVVKAVLTRLDDPDWNVRQQLAATLGELPAGARVPAMANLLERYGTDPVVVDAALSGLRGAESATMARLLTSSTESPQASAALTMLAATIVRGGGDADVHGVLDLVSDTGRAAWQRSTLLRGAEVALLGAAMPGNPGRRGGGPGPAAAGGNTPAARGAAAAANAPGGRGGPGGDRAFPGALEEDPVPVLSPLQRAIAAVTPQAVTRGGAATTLRLRREPSIVALSTGDDALATRARAVLARVEWPGKPGAAAAAPPLTPDEERRFSAGREVYASICAACHQPDGRGRQDLAPALVGSAVVLGPAEVPVRVLLNGKEGKVGLMPPLGAALDDDKVAAVLTYVRREWGHGGTPVDAALVAAARKESESRSRPWSEDELAQFVTSRLTPAGPRP